MLSFATSALAFTASVAPVMRTRAISMGAEVPGPSTPPPAPPALTSIMRVGDKTLAGDVGFDVRSQPKHRSNQPTPCLLRPAPRSLIHASSV